ncbi:HNH endonuclease [Trichocoleus sp. DQ-U1]|uniref:HNH endonuclease n=1 Tax=Trichocoleus sp. DQ-U1 TaxID=2933926 RepID=UPI0032974B2E
MAKGLSYYCNKFAKLNVSRSSGVAPNKPILLLSVIELISQGQIRQNQITLSVELISTFLKLWSNLEPVRQPNIGLPFFHLRGDGFWYLYPKPGFELLINSHVKIRAVSALQQTVEYAYLDQELFELLWNPDSRATLTDILISTWFSDKTQQIEQLLQVDAFQEIQERLRSQGGKVYQPEELEDEQTSIVRDAAFRKIVVSVYEYRCALCGLQILNSLGQNIVDGAHIKPFSQFYDDRINNGLSLCKNHHWAFDRFWFTISDDYTIIVADNLREDSPNSRPMREFRGDRIILPAQVQYYPRQDSLQWHQEEFLRRAA